jgi:hypothetical protein
VDQPDGFEVVAERILRGVGKQRNAVLATFPVPHDQRVAHEIQILYAKLQRLQKSKTGTVQQRDHQARWRDEFREHPPRFVAGEDDGEATWPFRSNHLLQVRKGQIQNVPLQKDNCIERLVLGRRRDPLPGGEV